MSSMRKITLISSDGESFEVDEAVAQQSKMIKHMIEDLCVDDGIPLPYVTGKILAKVIEYSKKHVETPKAEGGAADDELKNWDAEFVKVDRFTLFALMEAACCLKIDGLLYLICNTMKDSTTEILDIKSDTTPEEQEEVRRENQQAFEEEEEVRQENQWSFEVGTEVRRENQQAFEEEEEVHQENQWSFEVGTEVRRENQWATTMTIILISSDGMPFAVDETVAQQSLMIKHMIVDPCVDDGIPLPNVTGKVLAKVIEYSKKHVETPKAAGGAADDELKNWDAEFVKVDSYTLFDLLEAASYLNIKGLRNLISKALTDRIKVSTSKEIRHMFQHKNDYTLEEEAELRHEKRWEFE